MNLQNWLFIKNTYIYIFIDPLGKTRPTIYNECIEKIETSSLWQPVFHNLERLGQIFLVL
jgi:hypothetical protein